MQIYKALHEAMTDIAKTGIAKTEKNKEQGYNYRGVAAAMNALSPIFIKHKIIVVPSYSEYHEETVPTSSGGKKKFVRLKGTFKFVHTEDSSSVECACYGEGMDVSDKATTKAQSVAFRTALFTTFVVPFEGVHIDNEEDGDDAAAAISALLEGHIKEVRLTKTDADALAYWRKEKEAFRAFPRAYDEFKDATTRHRRALGAQPTTTGATQ